MKQDKFGNLWTLEAIAHELGVSRETVRLHVKAGRLQTQKLGTVIVAIDQAAQDFMAKYRAGTWPQGKHLS